MDYDRLTASIKAHEDYRREPYRDSLGKWTIGWGHLLEDTLIWSRFKTVGDLLTHICDKAQHSIWFEADVAQATARAADWLGWKWPKLTDIQQEVFAEMAFQLGNKVKRFDKLKAAVLADDWEKAKAEMKDSLWYQQTPNRVDDLASRLG